MEKGFGSLYNESLNCVRRSDGSRGGVLCHFVIKEKRKEGDKFYLYKGQGLSTDYRLIMMAIHFPEEKCLRLYACNDLDSESQAAMMSSEYRFQKENDMRV